jgi:hypothetical protein
MLDEHCSELCIRRFVVPGVQKAFPGFHKLDFRKLIFEILISNIFMLKY